jgi:hypothetical protein
MKTAFSPFGCVVGNNLSGSLPTEIGILLDLSILDFRRYSFVGNSDASSIQALIYCPPFSVNHSKFTNNTTTAGNSLSRTIPTEIGQLTKLLSLHLGKYAGCLRCFCSVFFI